MHRKLLSIVLGLCLLLVQQGFAETPVKKFGQLQVQGTQLCDQQGNPVMLRGISIGWHNLWPRFYNASVVRTLKNDWHASVVRAAMGIQIEDNYLENPTFAKQCVENIIKGAIKNGVYVVVDWHAHETHQAEAVEFFGYIAQKYGKRANIIYEVFNEPVEQSWGELKAYSEAIIQKIRQYDPDNIILVGCPHWDQDIHLCAADPIVGYSNIMYTVHFYAATHKEELRQRTAKAIKSGIPVFVSECGATSADGDGTIDETEWQNWITFMESNQISWINWSLSDKNESCSMLIPRAKSKGPWPDDVLKKTGKMAKQSLLLNKETYGF